MNAGIANLPIGCLSCAARESGVPGSANPPAYRQLAFEPPKALRTEDRGQSRQRQRHRRWTEIDLPGCRPEPMRLAPYGYQRRDSQSESPRMAGPPPATDPSMPALSARTSNAVNALVTTVWGQPAHRVLSEHGGSFLQRPETAEGRTNGLQTGGTCRSAALGCRR